MRLVGMLDSPYVRRVAISLTHLGVPFWHEAVSVFSTFEQFQGINPVVKAPTLVCDDGEVMMESLLILQYAEALPSCERSLWPEDPVERQHDFRAVSLALAACEKSVQIVYERNLRPKSAQHEPWIDRVTGQLLAAYAALEGEVRKRPVAFLCHDRHASITAAVAWSFTQSMLPETVPAFRHPELVAHAAREEATPQFREFPPSGPGVPVPQP